MDLPLEIVKRHLLLRLPEGRALVDTGAPFDMGRGKSAVLLGATWKPRKMLAVLDTAQEQLGVPIEFFVGHDLLSKNRLLCDWSGKAVLEKGPIALPGATRIAIELSAPVPLIEMVAGGTCVRAILDSGAMLSYAPEKAVHGLSRVREQQDFHPSIGAFSTDVWVVPASVGGRSIDVEGGVLPKTLRENLNVIGDGWILGSDFFRDRRIVLDYPGRCVLDAPLA